MSASMSTLNIVLSNRFVWSLGRRKPLVDNMVQVHLIEQGKEVSMRGCGSSDRGKLREPYMRQSRMQYAAILMISAMLVTCANALGQKQDIKTVAASQAAPSSTLANLQTAYNGESNAHIRYLSFAERADQEGYAGAASLFRAAAHAEEIHARNHAEVIKAMGAVAKADVKAPEVMSTAENLKTAIAGETYERDVMYPQFIAKAKADGNTGALRSFNYARAAEAGHAKLYKEAADNLAAWKDGPRDFYVCSICGNTVTKVDFARCPVCRQPRDNYKKVA